MTTSEGLPTSTSFFASTTNSQLAATVLAKVDPELDVIAQMQDAFNNFIDSGQGWALLIGLVLGYLFRSMTAY